MKYALAARQWDRRQQALSSLADSLQRLNELETPPEPLEMLAARALAVVRAYERNYPTMTNPHDVQRFSVVEEVDGLNQLGPDGDDWQGEFTDGA